VPIPDVAITRAQHARGIVSAARSVTHEKATYEGLFDLSMSALAIFCSLT
jgi:hypothetical protein